MPAYNTNKYSTPKYATIGKPVFSFGYDNSIANPVGPAAPAAPTLTASNIAGANITGNVFVQVAYVFPGSSPAQVNPATLPMGFASAPANVAVGSANAVVVTSPSASSDIANLAIGYNVFAGANANVVTLVNSNIVPIGTNFTIGTTNQLGQATGGASQAFSSPTTTQTGEVLTSNTAGLQFAVPVSGSNFQGQKAIAWKVQYANGTPGSANIALQAAFEDNANSYTTIDYTTNTSGDLRVVANADYSFIRAYCVTAPANTITSLVSVRVG